MEWIADGVLNDKDMPDIERLELTTMGEWISTPFTKPDHLLTITRAFLSYELEGEEDIKVYLRYDNDNWILLDSTQNLELEKVETAQTMQVKVTIRSTLGLLEQVRAPVVKFLDIVFEDEKHGEWRQKLIHEMNWEEVE